MKKICVVIILFGCLSDSLYAMEQEMRMAARGGDIAKVRSLLDGGADVNAMDGFSKTPLHLAFSKETVISMA